MGSFCAMIDRLDLKVIHLNEIFYYTWMISYNPRFHRKAKDTQHANDRLETTRAWSLQVITKFPTSLKPMIF